MRRASRSRRESQTLYRLLPLIVACIVLFVGIRWGRRPQLSLRQLRIVLFRDDSVFSVFRIMPASNRNIGYYTNWSIYARKFRPQDIDAASLTHVLYAFANVDADTGEVFLSDKWADEEIHWEGDSWNEDGTNLYGCLKQLYRLKRNNRHLKVLLSIGGWTYSQNGCFKGLSNDGNIKIRERFVRSSVGILQDYGLDGLDIDWEYPQNSSQASGYVLLLRALREALDTHALEEGESPYELTVAAPCGPSHIERLHIKDMDEYLTFWNLMAYDFAGSWSTHTWHQANLKDHGRPDELSVERAVQTYLSRGVAANKLVVGIPLYGRSFAHTDGLGEAFSGVGEGTWEAGSIDYHQLPRPGAETHFDPKLIASWSYDSHKREVVTYDTVKSAEVKADFIVKNALGGAMFWELSGDHNRGHPDALVAKVGQRLGKLEDRQNHLHYPQSKFDNIRAGLR